MVVNFRGKDLNAAGVRVSGTKITATPDEINQALDGISADVTAANLSELTGGAETDLHSHAASGGGSGLLESFTANGTQTSFPTVARPVGKRHLRFVAVVPALEIGDLGLPDGFTALITWQEAADLTVCTVAEDNGVQFCEVVAYFCDAARAAILGRGTSSLTGNRAGPVNGITLQFKNWTPDPPEAVALPAGTLLEVWAE